MWTPQTPAKTKKKTIRRLIIQDQDGEVKGFFWAVAEPTDECHSTPIEGLELQLVEDTFNTTAKPA